MDCISCLNSSLLILPSPLLSNLANIASICSFVIFLETWWNISLYCQQDQSNISVSGDLSKLRPSNKSISVLVKQLEGRVCAALNLGETSMRLFVCFVHLFVYILSSLMGHVSNNQLGSHYCLNLMRLIYTAISSGHH